MVCIHWHRSMWSSTQPLAVSIHMVTGRKSSSRMELNLQSMVLSQYSMASLSGFFLPIRQANLLCLWLMCLRSFGEGARA